MASTTHSFGPNRNLQPESNNFTRRASGVSDSAPKLRAHFFYSSALPIDDPLTPVPPPSNTPTGPSKVPPKPFSVHDNNDLEEAWQAMNKKHDAETDLQKDVVRTSGDSPSVSSDRLKVQGALTSLGGPTPTPATVVNLAKFTRGTHERRYAKLENEQSSEQIERAEGKDRQSPGSSGVATNAAETCNYKHDKAGDPHLTLCDSPDHIPFDYAMPVGSNEIGNEEFESGMTKKRRRSPFHRHGKTERPKAADVAVPTKISTIHSKKSSEILFGGSPSERDTTGTPFLRIPDRLRRTRSRSSRRETSATQTDGADSPHEEDVVEASQPDDTATAESQGDTSYRDFESTQDARKQRSSAIYGDEIPPVLVSVGVSRLHMVEMPALTVRGRKSLVWNDG